jgi:hypothetical protein
LKILFFACKCFIGRAGHISRAKKFWKKNNVSSRKRP